jgi:soluble epoxide hydrolase/lipid-phosphate phosphatase
VLFIMANEDEALPPSMSEDMVNFIPNLTREEVDCGHWALWQRAADVNRMIARWLEEKVLADQAET